MCFLDFLLFSFFQFKPENSEILVLSQHFLDKQKQQKKPQKKTTKKTTKKQQKKTMYKNHYISTSCL